MFSYDNESIRDRVRDLRTIGKDTQQDLAILLDIKRSTYQRIEGDGSFSWDQIEILADHYDVSPYFLKYGVTEEDIIELAHMVRMPMRLNQPNFTVFTGPIKRHSDLLYEQFLELSAEDRIRFDRLFATLNLK